MYRYKRFIFSLILLLLISTVVAVSHHHENTADDHDCPICIASNHLSATGLSTAAFDIIPCLAETAGVISAPALAENLFVAIYGTRGPPA